MNNQDDLVLDCLKELGIKNSKVIKPELYCNPVIVYSDELRFENNISDLWAKVFDNYYEKIISQKDSTNDSSVWKSSYTKEYIPKYEISDWVDGFIKKIDRFITKNTSVLEIGCGNGLIFNRIVSKIKNYTGIDNSYYAIESIKKSSTFESNKNKIMLHHCDASEIKNIDENKYDLIILNSVIQYFPSTEYLLDLISSLQQKVKPSTVIAIGDVRSFHSSNLHYYEMVKSRRNSQYYGSNLKKKIDSLNKAEKETLYTPIFFKTLHLFFDWISSSSVTLKSSLHLNEMTKYRYDVILYCGDSKEINYKTKENLFSLESEYLFSDSRKHLKLPENHSIVCKKIVNAYYNEIYLQYSNDLNIEKIDSTYVANYNKLVSFLHYLSKSNLFFDLYEHKGLNELYFFASRNYKKLSYHINIKNIDIFELSNRLTNDVPIPLLDFLDNICPAINLKKDELQNHYIYKIPKQLMLLLSMNQ